MPDRRPFVGGNWKMNTDCGQARALAGEVRAGNGDHASLAEVAVFPPFPYLLAVREVLAGSPILLGGQDVYCEANGAFTGEVSAAMLRDVGAEMVIIGHSERRHVIGEDDAITNRKLRAALDASLTVVFCVGETIGEREAGRTDEVTVRQLRAGLAEVPLEQVVHRLVIAYEPVWAIGTGRTASPQDAQHAHAVIRAAFAALYGESVAADVRLIYGGSVKPKNAAELFQQPDVDGFLVGGASLAADDFAAIVKATVVGRAEALES